MVAKARPAAGPEDVLAGLAVRHEAYERKVPLPVSQAMRLASSREHRAVPWVLDRGDGAIVSTLLCHPLELDVLGRVVPAYGLGSVGTRFADRRRGHAAALCRAACEANERSGRPVGLLYASVAPAYYERLGFVTCPASSHRCERLRALAESGDTATLVPVDPRREVERLCAAYREFHRGAIHPHRDAARFLESVEDCADDWFFAVRGLERGYVRLYPEDDGSLDVVEPIVLDPADEAPLLRAVARLALDAGKKAVTGWFEPPAAVREWFSPLSRAMNVPMLRGAPAGAAARFWASDHF